MALLFKNLGILVAAVLVFLAVAYSATKVQGEPPAEPGRRKEYRTRYALVFAGAMLLLGLILAVAGRYSS